MMPKKKIMIALIIIVFVILTISLFIIYRLNYKSYEEIVDLLEQGTKLNNVYAKRYVENQYFDENSRIKDYRVDILWKDNVLIYKDILAVDYYNFNNNEYLIFMNQQENKLNIENPAKFNEYLSLADLEKYTYKYVFPIYYNDSLCDMIEMESKYNDSKRILYINQETGLLMKEKFISSNECTCIHTYDYEFNNITMEDINKDNIKIY